MDSSANDPYVSGDVVRTAYGVGVLTSCPAVSNGSHFQVRLWRLPGKSIGSSSIAFLQSDAIFGRLPAAPGMVTSLVRDSNQRVMVHSFNESRNVYLVSPMNGHKATETMTVLSPTSTEGDEAHQPSVMAPQWEDEMREVAPDELAPAASAKFYPLLQELMAKGDQTAAATAELMRSDAVSSLVQKSTDLVESSTTTSVAITPHDVSESVKTAIPKEQDVKHIYAMLKDEELTVLLEKGRERLQQLVSTDMPHATEVALQKAGITIVSDSEHSVLSESMIKSREKALAALEDLLDGVDVNTVDLQAVRGQLEENFTTMFDALSHAAKSDRNLSAIFDTISGKTFEWQEATGRLMQTKSVGLFLEGASRLQARAASMFSKDHMQWAGEIGTKFTKAFTEGDAAVARLKSIELGDAVRSRLVNAIEVRSESHGGLDGIIAGALTTMTQAGDASGDQMQDLLKSLQQRASGASKEAHETLISVLSQRSQYRDAALLRIEGVLCDLESQLGDDVSPSEIAALARGEAGTSALFEPIARRAAKEIEKQLDVAEASISDPTILGGLENVRKIISGELSVSGLLDEVVKILNDSSVVAAGESFVKHGETVLDAIEGVSGNKVVGDVMQIAEKAGITKDSVMSQMEALNVNEILDTAESAVSDEKARLELVSSATDIALDFILRILPSMPVPPFDGVKDGLLYHLSNLSMEGFKVRKENIHVEVAGMRATKKPLHPDEEASDSPQYGPPANAAISRDSSSSAEDGIVMGDEVLTIDTRQDASRRVKATELLIIDVRKISAEMDDIVWSFEQTYMPYLKGGGKANVKLSDGAIRLQFELRRKRRTPSKDDTDELQWEPVLCLHDRSCSIGAVDLVLQGEGRITWILNKLASIFKGPLRDYVVGTIVGVLTSKSGYILDQLNKALSPYWGLILRTAGLSMDELVEAGTEDISSALPSEEESLVELVWRESLPLGMNLLLNDDSGLLKIVDFPRGSQARAVCVQKRIDPEVFNGATIIAVNGSRYDTKEELFGALKDPGRPKSVLFKLAEQEDAERIKRFVEGDAVSRKHSSVEDREQDREHSFSLRSAMFTEAGGLGIEFANAIDGIGLVVSDFLTGDDGIVLAAERQSKILRGDLLTHINGKLVLGQDGEGKQRAVSMLEAVGDERPLVLSFSEGYLFNESFEKPSTGIADIGGADEFILQERQLPDGSRRIILDDFENVSGQAEAGGVLIGDHLVFINAVPVGAGCRLIGEDHSPELHEIYGMLRNETGYPIGLTFARPKQAERRWTGSPYKQRFNVEAAETICITADSFEHLGCVFENKDGSDIVITDLFAVAGPIQQKMRKYKDSSGNVHLSVESVNGQFVPSYATADIVKNAMKRTSKSSGKLEVVFCDDSRKKWIQSLT